MYLGKVGHHVLRRQDITLGIEEREIDRLVLDLPEPWQVVPEAVRALRTGGIFSRTSRPFRRSSASLRRSRGRGRSG
jgi:tRNA A58 N-methylase Trm61